MAIKCLAVRFFHLLLVAEQLLPPFHTVCLPTGQLETILYQDIGMGADFRNGPQFLIKTIKWRLNVQLYGSFSCFQQLSNYYHHFISCTYPLNHSHPFMSGYWNGGRFSKWATISSKNYQMATKCLAVQFFQLLLVAE